MMNTNVLLAKPQEKAKKLTFKQRYGAIIDRTGTEMDYDTAQKALFTKTVRRLDRGVAL